MGRYWKRCPYCGRVTESGYGLPHKELGDPTTRCVACRQIYKDSCIIDWPEASIFGKISYFFANGRFWLCFLPSLMSIPFLQARTVIADWLIYLISFAILSVSVTLCALYVRWKVKDYYGDDYDDYDDDYDDDDDYGEYDDDDDGKPKVKYITLKDTTFGRLDQNNKK
jgi:hypothetical protein